RRPVPARRESAEVAVGKRQHHQFGRVLTRVERGVRFLQPVAFAEDDMHADQAPTVSGTRTARIAAGSTSSCSPITTSLDARAASPQGLSYCARMRSPTACTSIRIGLPRTAT